MPSRVVVRLSASCTGTNVNYQYEFGGGTSPACGSLIVPALRFTATPSITSLLHSTTTRPAPR